MYRIYEKTGKKQGKATYKKPIGALCLIILAVVIVNLTMISALDFDNVRSYDKSTKTITIDNAFGLGERIAEVKLETPLVHNVIDRGPGVQQLVAEITINNHDEGYDTFWRDLDLYNVKGGMNKFDREIELRYLNNNNWILLETNKLDSLPSGEITIGLFTDVQPNDNVEWIPTIFGERIEEWAMWLDTFNVDIISYYPMDNLTDTVNETWNMTTNEGTISYVTGLIGNAGKFESNKNTFINKSDADENWGFAVNTTLNLWVNFTSTTRGVVAKQKPDGGGAGWMILCGTAICNVEDLGVGDLVMGGVTQHAWTMITLVMNDTNVSAYKDGVLMDVDNIDLVSRTSTNITFGEAGSQGESEPDIYIDEIGLWNRSLTLSEITDLYNIGVGISYDSDPPVVLALTTTLTAPSNNFETSNISLGFEGAFSINSGNLTNGTLYLQNSSGSTWFNFTIINGTTNSTNLTLIPHPDKFNWTYYSCGINNTASTCDWADSNRTIIVNALNITAESFSSTSGEGNSERFEVNVTLFSGQSLSTAILIYNNTEFSTAPTNLGDGIYTISKSVTTPNIDITRNITFWWNFITGDGYTYNSSFTNQTITIVGIDNCSTFNNELFNITNYDEDTQAFLGGSTENVTINVEFTLTRLDGETIANYSTGFTYSNPVRICMENNFSLNDNYDLDGVISYKSKDRFQEFYHLQDYTINNDSSKIGIKLYNLNSSKGEEYKITYKDANFVAVEGALLNIQRKYIDEGVFKTTEVPKTGAEGYTIAHMVSNDVIYNIIITKFGTTLATFTDVVADCQLPLLRSCEINLNSFSSSNIPSDFTNYGDLSFTLTYDKDTREVESIYTIPSGVSTDVTLNVTLFDSLGNTTVCSDTLTAAGGTLDCIVPLSFGNTTIVAKLIKEDSTIGQSVISIKPDPVDIYGDNLIFLALMVFLIILGIGAASDNPIAMGITIMMGSFILIGLNLIASTSLLGKGATILWFMIAVVLVLIKGGSRQ